MLTIAGGIVLGFLAIVLLVAMVMTETGQVILAVVFWLAVLGAVSFVLYVIFEDLFLQIVGALIGMSIAGKLLGEAYDAVERWKARRVAQQAKSPDISSHS